MEYTIYLMNTAGATKTIHCEGTSDLKSIMQAHSGWYYKVCQYGCATSFSPDYIKSITK